MEDDSRLSPITAFSVKGFKSFAEEKRIEVRPLTLLAGANSSGKSSAIQPLLLLKQTLEARYDPGAVLLDGPNVRFTEASQLLSKVGGEQASEFVVCLELSDDERMSSTFVRSGYGFDITRMAVKYWGLERPDELVIEPWMKERELIERGILSALSLESYFSDSYRLPRVKRYRCFLDVIVEASWQGVAPLTNVSFWGSVLTGFSDPLLAILHIPGARVSPARSYGVTAIGPQFPGTFDSYVASVLASWRNRSSPAYELVNADLKLLGLPFGIEAQVLNASQVELLVRRTPANSTASDFVNIADVGLGVSQVLPVIVALEAAMPNQLVYIDQPELHLHPRAQQAMAEVLSNAARRGVRVVAETHSSILLLAVQSLVAEGKLDPALVKLHWFQRDERGATQVHSTDLDENGAYGDWPEDFGEVQAQADNRYLDAVEARAFSRRSAAKRAKVKKK